jgi:hypothetical protein
VGGSSLARAQLPYRPGESNPWGYLAASIAQGLLSGAATGYGESQAENYRNTLQTGLANALSSENPRAVMEADPILQPLAGQYALAEAAQAEELKQYMLQQQMQHAAALDLARQKKGIELEYAPQLEAIKAANKARFRVPTSDEGTITDKTVQGALVAARNGLPLTAEQDAAVAKSDFRTQRLFEQARQQAGIQDRFDTGMTYKERQAGKADRERIVGPYKPYSEQAPRLDKTEAKVLRGEWSGTQAVKKNLKELASNDQYAITGSEAISNKALSGIIFNQLRAATNSGANLTTNEIKFMEGSVIPTLAGGKPIATLMATLTGRERKEAARVIGKALEGSFDAKMAAIGYTRTGGIYDEEQKSFLELHWGGQKQAEPAPAPVAEKAVYDPLGIR